jgi:methionyl-tRNA formyltransferase
MNIVLLTNKNSLVIKILDQLTENNIKISAILIEDPLPKTKIALIKLNIKKCIPTFLISFLRKIRKLDPVQKWENNKNYKKYSTQILIVDNFNSKKSESILEELNPDLIILAGSRILKKNIIKIPQIGILNAHPGLLPKYRGIDVIPWAIYNDDIIGVTVHFIDEGVDTGRICKQQEIEIDKNDTIESLRRKAEIISANLLKNVVFEIIQNKETPIFQNKKEDGTQFYKMDNKTIKEVEEKLKNKEY